MVREVEVLPWFSFGDIVRELVGLPLFCVLKLAWSSVLGTVGVIGGKGLGGESGLMEMLVIEGTEVWVILLMKVIALLAERDEIIPWKGNYMHINNHYVFLQ